MKTPGIEGQAAVPGDQVAVGIHFEFSLEDDGVFGSWPIATKYTVKSNVVRSGC